MQYYQLYRSVGEGNSEWMEKGDRKWGKVVSFISFQGWALSYRPTVAWCLFDGVLVKQS